jgi:hypothetical protein
MAAEMVTDRWEGVRNKASVVPNPTWKAVAEAISALDGSVRTLVSIVYQHPSLISIGGGGSNGLYVVQATDDGERFKVATSEADKTQTVMITAGGQEGDYLARRCVDLATALRAARTFTSTGEMDATISWEE